MNSITSELLLLGAPEFHQDPITWDKSKCRVQRNDKKSNSGHREVIALPLEFSVDLLSLDLNESDTITMGLENYKERMNLL